MSVWASIASGVLSAGSAIGNTFLQSANTNKTIKAQKQAAELEWQRNREAWDAYNSYNHPSAQRERYEQAGFNPNLVVSQGSSGNASSMPTYQAPRPEYKYKIGNLAEGISAYQQINLQSAQVDNVKANNEVLREQANNLRIKNRLEELGLKAELYEDPLLGSTQDARARSRLSEYLGNEAKGLISQHEAFKSQREQDVITQYSNEYADSIRSGIQQQIKKNRNLDQDFLLKLQRTIAQRLENEYRELGISNGDNIAFRIIARILRQYFPNLKF